MMMMMMTGNATTSDNNLRKDFWMEPLIELSEQIITNIPAPLYGSLQSTFQTNYYQNSSPSVRKPSINIPNKLLPTFQPLCTEALNQHSK